VNDIDLRRSGTPAERASTEPDSAEFVGLYEAHARTIHRYLARRVGTDLADDLVADTFLIALRRWATFDHAQGTPIAWLYGIATNLARNHQRKERAELVAVQRLDARPERHDDPLEQVVTRLDAHRRVRSLGAAVAKLKPGDRDALLLIAWTELSYQQVAEALDVPIGTVRSRLHRARKQLQAFTKRLDELGENR